MPPAASILIRYSRTKRTRGSPSPPAAGAHGPKRIRFDEKRNTIHEIPCLTTEEVARNVAEKRMVLAEAAKLQRLLRVRAEGYGKDVEELEVEDEEREEERRRVSSSSAPRDADVQMREDGITPATVGVRPLNGVVLPFRPLIPSPPTPTPFKTQHELLNDCVVSGVESGFEPLNENVFPNTGSMTTPNEPVEGETNPALASKLSQFRAYFNIGFPHNTLRLVPPSPNSPTESLLDDNMPPFVNLNTTEVKPTSFSSANGVAEEPIGQIYQAMRRHSESITTTQEGSPITPCRPFKGRSGMTSEERADFARRRRSGAPSPESPLPVRQDDSPQELPHSSQVAPAPEEAFHMRFRAVRANPPIWEASSGKDEFHPTVVRMPTTPESPESQEFSEPQESLKPVPFCGKRFAGVRMAGDTVKTRFSNPLATGAKNGKPSFTFAPANSNSTGISFGYESDESSTPSTTSTSKKLKSSKRRSKPKSKPLDKSKSNYSDTQVAIKTIVKMPRLPSPPSWATHAPSSLLDAVRPPTPPRSRRNSRGTKRKIDVDDDSERRKREMKESMSHAQARVRAIKCEGLVARIREREEMRRKEGLQTVEGVATQKKIFEDWSGQEAWEKEFENDAQDGDGDVDMDEGDVDMDEGGVDVAGWDSAWDTGEETEL